LCYFDGHGARFCNIKFKGHKALYTAFKATQNEIPEQVKLYIKDHTNSQNVHFTKHGGSECVWGPVFGCGGNPDLNLTSYQRNSPYSYAYFIKDS
jgi:hypothetical protein